MNRLDARAMLQPTAQRQRMRPRPRHPVESLDFFSFTSSTGTSALQLALDVLDVTVVINVATPRRAGELGSSGR